MTRNKQAKENQAGDVLALETIEKAADSRWDKALSSAFATTWNEDGKEVIKYPIDLKTLLDASLMSSYHRRCLVFKRIAAIGSGYQAADPAAVAAVLPWRDLVGFVDDVLTFANGYLETERNANGELVRLHHVRANTLWKAPKGGWRQRTVEPGKTPTYREIAEEKIVHLFEYCPLSDHYGIPDYLPALLPIALSYEADDFHRKFYQNGAHAGLVILLKGIRNLSKEQRDAIEEKFKSTKGPGNFASIFMAFASTDPEIEIKGVAKEAPVRDDYPEITKSTREKILSAHGIPPRLMSIILDAKSGAMAGQVDEELRLFNLAWVEPFQLQLEAFLNALLPEALKFKPFLVSRADNSEASTSFPAVSEPLEEVEED